MANCTPKKFDLAKYQDRYTQKLTQLIEAKVAGKEIVAAPASQPVHVINLVEALQKSLAEADKAIAGESSKRQAPHPARRKLPPPQSKPTSRRKKTVATA